MLNLLFEIFRPKQNWITHLLKASKICVKEAQNKSHKNLPIKQRKANTFNKGIVIAKDKEEFWQKIVWWGWRLSHANLVTLKTSLIEDLNLFLGYGFLFFNLFKFVYFLTQIWIHLKTIWINYITREYFNALVLIIK